LGRARSAMRGRGFAAFAAAMATTFALAGAPARAIEPAVCSGCKPPLVYGNGPVLPMNNGGLTVTPIYWEPGGKYKFPAGYENIINTFIVNVAAASGSTTNAFSVSTEYYQDIGGARTSVTYAIHAGTPIVDTDAFPSNGCKPASGHTGCFTDAQLQTELKHVLSSKSLPSDLAHFYPVFFPAGVESQDSDGSTSVGSFCAYHGAFGSGANQTVYANMPVEASCATGQAPNGNADADGEVSTLSHELIEAITDPEGSDGAWLDKAGNEIGDMCAWTFGQPLGSTDSSNPGRTEYNQVINGGKYYLQQEFSNVAFAKFGIDHGCIKSEGLATQPPTGSSGASTSSGNSGSASSHAGHNSASTLITVINDVTPTTLPADGSSTAEVSLGVADQAGNSVANDPVHFIVGVESGTGQCGTLNTSDKSTNSDGNADITYTASTSNVACWVIATEARTGHAAVATIYQGTTQKQSPTFNASYPTAFHAGGSTDFTVKATNPTSKPLVSTRATFIIFPGDGATKNVNANQVQLSYSTTGPNGTFTPVALSGSTITDGAIQGHVGPLRGVTLAPDSTTTYTFDVALASTVPVVKRKPLMAFETYLEQINTADGTGTTLGDTYAHEIVVPSVISPSTSVNVWAAIAAALGLAIGGLLIWRTAKDPPKQTPPQPA
jgi:hypothetical protein